MADYEPDWWTEYSDWMDARGLGRNLITATTDELKTELQEVILMA